jgi:trehalose 6-phosphate synthase
LSRLVAVSNRVADPKRGKSAGGLAVGLLAALRQRGGLWFGWGGQTCQGEPSDASVSKRGNISFATIDLFEADLDNYYNGYSNICLWPLCHYMLGFFRFERRFEDAYRRVNRLFARKLLPLLTDDDIIWIHDYHLIPLASELRRAGVSNPIGFFLHVPFPNFDVLRSLPGHVNLMRQLCEYDVVGFQTRNDVRNFVEGLDRTDLLEDTLGDTLYRATGRNVTVDAFPIGVDVDGIMRIAEKSVTSATVKRTLQGLAGRDLMIGVDRLDYSKGLPERFRAVEDLLVRYPDTRNRLVFMQFAPPTRTGVRAYQDIRESLERSAGHINGRFAEPDWVPIRYLNRGFSRNMLIGLMRSAQIGLVTPLRDGMNLVAKEYVAAQDPADPGALVLSTLAGAAAELKSAMLVNPFDVEGIAEGIQKAVNMSLSERRDRYHAMIDVLRENSIDAWRRRFIETLCGVTG